MTCPSADRLCPIPGSSDGPPRPEEASSPELPPSKPGLKLGRLLSPTCANMWIPTKKTVATGILLFPWQHHNPDYSLRLSLGLNIFPSTSQLKCIINHSLSQIPANQVKDISHLQNNYFLTSCLDVLGNSRVLALFLLAVSSSSSVSSSLAGHESMPVAASLTSGIRKSSWRNIVTKLFIQLGKATFKVHFNNLSGTLQVSFLTFPGPPFVNKTIPMN